MIARLSNISLLNSFFLFGQRGTGKSTLIKHILEDKNPLVINLLDKGILRELQASPEKLSKILEPTIGTGRVVFIDEIQKIPELLDLVHLHIEQDGILFALTGSSARKLKRGASNLLAGRAFVYKLFPLHVLEYKDLISLDDALRWGTLPFLLKMPDEILKSKYLVSYVETYLTEEIIEEQLIRKIPPFTRFLPIAAQLNGHIINFSNIARDVAIDVTTIKNYYSILEETLIGFYLEAFDYSLRKRQRKNSKFYFTDTGVVRTLSKLIDVPLREESKEYGSYFESFVINQIKSYLEYKGKQFKISYFSSSDNAEIDMVIERGGEKTFLIEIKSSVYYNKSLSTLKKVTSEIKNSRGICLYRGNLKLKDENIEVLPWQEIFHEL